MEVAQTALVARVSGVRIHDLERGDNEGPGVNQARLKFVFSPRVVNLALVTSLKGKPSHVSRIKVSQCRGSLDAKLGDRVRVYKIHGDWWIDAFPEAPE